MDLLRFSTAGSVDDGKSTLIGRLLFDSKGIFEDQFAAIERTSRRRGNTKVDLALLTDGLRAEREQGITIDVAYRYFATPRRKFIIADTPGHVQYTRNMVTGASTADLAIVLVDARNGVLEQSRRHAFIAALLGIPHIVVAVNKMDLVGYRRGGLRGASGRSSPTGPPSSPSATCTSSPSRRSTATTSSSARCRCPGTRGRRCCTTWRTSTSAPTATSSMPGSRCSGSIRPQSDEHHDFRGYAGQVAGGVFRTGDEVVVLPSGRQTRISRISTLDGELETAAPPMSVIIELADDIDVSRGDMLSRPHNQPTVAQELEAMVCWMAEAPLRQGARYYLKHTTRTVKAIVDDLRYGIDVNTLHREPATELGLNAIGRVRLRTSRAADARRVPRQPDHGRLHPHRRGDLRHGRRRHGRAGRPGAAHRDDSRASPDHSAVAGSTVPGRPERPSDRCRYHRGPWSTGPSHSS